MHVRLQQAVPLKSVSATGSSEDCDVATSNLEE